MFCHTGPLVRGFPFVVPNLGIGLAAEGGICNAFQNDVKDFIASCHWLTMQGFHPLFTKMAAFFRPFDVTTNGGEILHQNPRTERAQKRGVK